MLKKNKKNIIKIIIFSIFILINLILLLNHELWRDEAHAWLMAKNLNIIELIKVSKFDGHPILWHLILMPFAKLGFPYITIQIINLIICLIAAYIFYFKIKMNDIFKTIILFGSPFIYVYTIIARNYCLILLLCMLIVYLYKDRYNKPYKYIILLCLLLNTPTISWGFAIALFIFFEGEAIYKLIKNNPIINKKQIIITSIIFIITLILVCLELSNTSNPDFQKPFSYSLQPSSISTIKLLLLSSFIFGLISIIFDRRCIKEYCIFLIAILFQIFIIKYFYMFMINPRLHYQCIIWLSYILIIINIYDNKYLKLMPFLFITLNLTFSYMAYELAYNDLISKYSNSKETANWINNNIDDKEILITNSTMCQSIIPYLKNKEVYDIYYEDNFDNLKTYSYKLDYKDYNLKKYNNKYIVSHSFDFYSKYHEYLEEVYRYEESSLVSENYVIYKITYK